MKQTNRTKVIVKTSVIGIISNFFLSAFKVVAGLISNSIAIVLDAVNNLSDGLSSLITIIGTKLAGKKPDKKHPYGHGRVEYLSSMIIAIIIIYAGLTSFWESIKNIVFPQTPDYSVVAIVIVSVAIVVKILLGIYFKKIGKKVNSDSLTGSGNDALMDSIISAATLLSAFIFMIFGLSLEAYLGVIISILIFRTGFSMIRNSISQILGERVDNKVSLLVKEAVANHKGVKGVYDLVLNNYGPDKYMGSIHIEVADTTTAIEIDALTREIMKDVYDKCGVILTAVGIYSLNTQDKEVFKIRKTINEIIKHYTSVLQLHGFYVNKKDKVITFDIILDFADNDRNQTYQQILSEVQAKFAGYKVLITMDIDVSE